MLAALRSRVAGRKLDRNYRGHRICDQLVSEARSHVTFQQRRGIYGGDNQVPCLRSAYVQHLSRDDRLSRCIYVRQLGFVIFCEFLLRGGVIQLGDLSSEVRAVSSEKYLVSRDTLKDVASR